MKKLFSLFFAISIALSTCGTAQTQTTPPTPTEPFTGKYCGRGARPKYGDKVDVRKMKKNYLKSDKKENGVRTQIYQANLFNKGFAFSINTDLKLPYEKLFDYYILGPMRVIFYYTT